MTRQQDRYESAKRLCACSPDYLFDNFGITRVGELTGLDCIGVPVWSACRPMSHSVSVSAGKSRDSFLAKAGAIAEAIEVAMFESPGYQCSSQIYRKEQLVNFGFPMSAAATDSVYEIQSEPVLHYVTNTEINFPSDLIWLDHRGKSPFLRSSNGQALGATLQDAVLQGLYECIERDAMTIREMTEIEFGVIEGLIDLTGAPDTIGLLVHKIARAGLRLFVFRCTFDIPLPIYCASLLDPSESHAQFYGYGTSIFDCVAVEKAILEAIQSRVVYIAGARDDIAKSRFEEAKAFPHKALIHKLNLQQPRLPVDWSSYDITTKEELDWAINDIGPWAGKMFIKVLDRDFPAAKVIIPGLEPPRMEGWTSVRWDQVKHEMQNSHFRRPDPVRS